MNDNIKSEHLNWIANTLQQAVGLSVIEKGFINPEHYRQNPTLENFWVDGYDFTFFIICENVSPNQENFLSRFIRQKVTRHSIPIEGAQMVLLSFGGGYCYFRPGDLQKQINIGDQQQETQYLDTHVRIPAWLDDVVFHDLQAMYAPNHVRFATNLELNEEEVKLYLGTYCLRSYGEAYVIFKNIFSNQELNKIWKLKGELNILDIGSGTGGNLSGFIMALKDSFDIPLKLNITSLDGNRNMLTYQEPLIRATIEQYTGNINIRYRDFIIHSPDDLESIASELDKNLDLIMTFKCLSEITEFQEIYHHFVSSFAELLAPDGLLMILDVTTKDNLPDFNPILMNNEIRSFENHSKFRTLLPISCAIHATICKSRCFTQQQFLISHSHKENDLSKVAYRIIGRKEFVDFLLTDISDAKFVTKWKARANNVPEPTGFCFNCNGTDNLVDAYYLS